MTITAAKQPPPIPGAELLPLLATHRPVGYRFWEKLIIPNNFD
jgi:hypothetical protein